MPRHRHYSSSSSSCNDDYYDYDYDPYDLVFVCGSCNCGGVCDHCSECDNCKHFNVLDTADYQTSYWVPVTEEVEVDVIDIFSYDFEDIRVEIAQKDDISQALYAFLDNNNVSNAWYLFKCKWFTQSFELIYLLSNVVNAGRADRVNVYADNFQQHLEELML